MYGNKRVVDNVTMSLFREEIVVLLGKAGSGKSIFLDILAG